MTETTEETNTETTTASEEASAAGENKTLPTNLFSDEMPKEEVTPLDGPAKEKPYGALPDETQQQPDSDVTTEKTEPTTTTSSEPVTSNVQPAATAPMTPEEKQSQAKMTVDLILKAYEKLHSLGRWVGKQDDGELMQLHSAGKINLDHELPMPGDKKISVGQFFKEYNDSIETNIVVSDDFKNDIRPPLEREAIRRGWFVSDLLYVGILATEDITTKASMLMGLKKSCNMVLQACIEIQKKQKPNTSTHQEEHRATEENKTSDAPGPDDTWKEPE